METIQEKKIVDYLHLYIGCECFNHQRLLGVEGNAAYVSHPAVGRKVLDISAVRPILRQLSSMTEDEKNNMLDLDKAYVSDNVLPEIRASKLTNLHNSRKGHEQTRYLLSKHFDLFGLIDCGLAIDSENKKP